jgi:hypothetical protein
MAEDIRNRCQQIDENGEENNRGIPEKIVE